MAISRGNGRTRYFIIFGTTCALLLISFLWALDSGSIAVGWWQLLTGLFNHQNEQVEVVKDLRLPRTIIACFVGLCLPVSAAYLQVVTRNPLAEAGILGVSSGSLLFYYIGLIFLPTFLFFLPIFVFVGGFCTYLLLFLISRKQQNQLLTLIISGIALNAMFTSMNELIVDQLNLGKLVVTPQLGMKTWGDVRFMVIGGTLFLLFSFVCIKWGNVLSLSDSQLAHLGVATNKWRFLFIFLAVVLNSLAVATVGVVSFLGLIAVHIARRIVGNRYERLLPYAALVGAILMLTADTLGRTLFLPVEISANTLLSIIGAPCLIYLLIRRKRG